ncbi:MAG: hypothetical protein ACW99U_09550 [Candidatus Thorarchaeota archaeon]|jgi:hypothetical protein
MGVTDRIVPVTLIVAGPVIAVLLYLMIPGMTLYPGYINALITGGLITVVGIPIWPLTDLRVIKGKERRVVEVVGSQEKITIDELSISTGIEPGTIRLLLYDAMNDADVRDMIKSRVYIDTGSHAPERVTPSRCPILFIVIGAAMAGVGVVVGGLGAFAFLGGGGIGLAGILLFPAVMFVENRLAKQRIIGAAIAHESISVLDISSVTGQPVNIVTRHLYNAMNNDVLKGEIREGVFVSEEKADIPTPVPERKLMAAAAPDTPSTPIEGVDILRGCASVGGNFEYKVKIQNNTESVINKVTVTLFSYPDDCMKLDGEPVRRISLIEPGGFRSPQFILTPTKDCVEGRIIAIVSFLDHQHKFYSVEAKPYVIKSVCDLLEPLDTTLEKLEFMLHDMAANSEKFTLSKTPNAVFLDAQEYLPERNFKIIEAKSFADEGEYRATIRGLAQGKYTQNKVAVRVVIAGPAEGMKSEVLVEALCDDAAMLPITIEEITQGLHA